MLWVCYVCVNNTTHLRCFFKTIMFYEILFLYQMQHPIIAPGTTAGKKSVDCFVFGRPLLYLHILFYKCTYHWLYYDYDASYSIEIVFTMYR